jgi:hypothetical protein
MEKADQPKPSKMAKFLIESGFEGDQQKSWLQKGIPDTKSLTPDRCRVLFVRITDEVYKD